MIQLTKHSQEIKSIISYLNSDSSSISQYSDGQVIIILIIFQLQPRTQSGNHVTASHGDYETLNMILDCICCELQKYHFYNHIVSITFVNQLSEGIIIFFFFFNRKLTYLNTLLKLILYLEKCFTNDCSQKEENGYNEK